MKHLQAAVRPTPYQISPVADRGEKENLTLHIIKKIRGRLTRRAR